MFWKIDAETFGHLLLIQGEGLANNLVMSIYEDKAGNIWFGGGGLRIQY